MSIDFKESLIQLMQHPVMHKPLDELSNEELSKAYDLTCDLEDFMRDEEYTLLDYIQMARVKFFLGELSCYMGESDERVDSYFKKALQYMEKGGIDMSIRKCAELISLRTLE